MVFMADSDSPGQNAGATGVTPARDPAHVIREAAQWLAILHSGQVTACQQREFQAWCDAHPAHRQAWQAAQQLSGKFGSVPAALALPVLTPACRPSRRATLKSIAGVGVIGALGWQVHRHQLWQTWQADYSTAAGQQQRVVLPDGSHIVLNTATAMDLRFNRSERSLLLYRGEIMVLTAKDTQIPSRPFMVHTRQGRMQALGTRFAVRILSAAVAGPSIRESGATPPAWAPEDTVCALHVLEHVVAITPRNGTAALHVHPGQQVWFDQHHVCRGGSPVSASPSWIDGVLYADDMRLDDFLRELARYRSGVLQCAPEVAGLRLSGAFQLDDTEKILSALANTLPIRIRRLPYWTRIEAQ